MAVTPRENEIISLYEAGQPVDAIAARLQLSFGYVSGRVRELCLGVGADDGRYRRAMAAASNALLTAIQRERAA